MSGTTTALVRWNGTKSDPDEIVQYGHTFPKGEWVEVEVSDFVLSKFRGNKYFEVDSDAPAAAVGPAVEDVPEVEVDPAPEPDVSP